MVPFTFSDRDRVIHSIKTAFACLIGYIITRFMRLPVDQWLIITILVVMCAQAYVGSMIQKSSMRFFGTLLGSLVAAVTIMTVGTNHAAVGCVIVFSAMLFSYLATSQSSISESGTLGAVTVAIILIGQDPTLLTVGGRFLEISGGILIAALVSQFIFPIHAKNSLRKKQVQTLRQLRSYYLASLLTDQNNKEADTNYQNLDESIINLLIAQRKLSTEASRELFSHKEFVVAKFSNLLKYEREILRTITLMHQIYQYSPEIKKIFSTMQFLNEFHDKICNALEKLSNYIDSKNKTYIEFSLPRIELIKNTLQQHPFLTDESSRTYAYSFLFCAEILIERLNEITLVASEFSR